MLLKRLFYEDDGMHGAYFSSATEGHLVHLIIRAFIYKSVCTIQIDLHTYFYQAAILCVLCPQKKKNIPDLSN